MIRFSGSIGGLPTFGYSKLPRSKLCRTSHYPFVERLIGTIRREYLDQVPFWTSNDLEKKLLLFKDYFNQQRVHQGLDGTPPDEHDCIGERKVADLNSYRWEKLCRGL